MVDLVLAVGFHAFIEIHPMAFAQVEQRSRRNRHYQFVSQPLPHISLQAFTHRKKSAPIDPHSNQ
ncbi:hypothetical protein D9M73_168120 [compost metagenome]